MDTCCRYTQETLPSSCIFIIYIVIKFIFISTLFMFITFIISVSELLSSHDSWLGVASWPLPLGQQQKKKKRKQTSPTLPPAPSSTP